MVLAGCAASTTTFAPIARADEARFRNPVPRAEPSATTTLAVSTTPATFALPEVDGVTFTLGAETNPATTLTATVSAFPPPACVPLTQLSSVGARGRGQFAGRRASRTHVPPPVSSTGSATRVGALQYLVLTSPITTYFNETAGTSVRPASRFGGSNAYLAVYGGYYGLQDGPAMPEGNGNVTFYGAEASYDAIEIDPHNPLCLAIARARAVAFSPTLSQVATIGTPSTISVTIDALDALGRAIDVTGPLDAPVRVSDEDASGHTSMTATPVTDLKQPVPLHYDGHGDAFRLDAEGGGITGSRTHVTALEAEHVLTGSASPEPMLGTMAVGSDGNFWSHFGTKVGYATPSGAFTAVGDPNSNHQLTYKYDVVADSSGNLYFDMYDYDVSSDAIDRVTPPGVFATVTLPGYVEIFAMARGGDGAVYVSYSTGADYDVARIGPAGTVTNVTSTGNLVRFLTAGPDGNVWGCDGTYVDKITPSGTLTQYSVPGSASFPILSFVAGPDGNFWAPYANGAAQLVKFDTGGNLVSTTPLAYPTGVFDLFYGPTGPNIGQMLTEGSRVYLTDLNSNAIVAVDAGGHVVEYPTNQSGEYLLAIGRPDYGGPLSIATGTDGNLYEASNYFVEGQNPQTFGALTKLDTTLW